MYKFICFLVKAFMSLIFRIKVNGSENIPAEGGFLLCSNHLSNWDPPLLQICIKRRIRYMAKDELFHVPVLGAVLKGIKAIPVKRSGSDITAIKTAIRTVKDGGVIGIFPTGQREKVKGEGEVKAGVGLLAVKTEVPVVPVYINAKYRIFSKVTVTIGKPQLYCTEEGVKATAQFLEDVSKEIYASIKKLDEV